LTKLRNENLPRESDHFTIPEQGGYLVMDFVKGDKLQSLVERNSASKVSKSYKFALFIM
jgi:hypothetical protein